MATEIVLVILLLAVANATGCFTEELKPPALGHSSLKSSCTRDLKLQTLLKIEDELWRRYPDEISTLYVAEENISEALDQYTAIVNEAFTRRDQHFCQEEISEEELIRRENLGVSSMYPAYSCKEIAEKKPERSSGFYWVQTCQLSIPIHVYCNLDKVLIYGSKGWMRIAFLNMTDPQQQCPPGFDLYSIPKRLCGRTISGPGCNSITYKVPAGVQYQKVCGRIIGYQRKSPDAFKRLNCPSPCTIGEHYVDGISITRGSQPRKHVWTYAAGLVGSQTQPPSFVGTDYYCESARYLPVTPLHTTATDDVLWDGKQCDWYDAGCCFCPGLPWFCKDFLEPTMDDLELRLCLDEGIHNEDVPIELVELYIQ